MGTTNQTSEELLDARRGVAEEETHARPEKKPEEEDGARKRRKKLGGGCSAAEAEEMVGAANQKEDGNPWSERDGEAEKRASPI
jgi:hypothetical protein